MSYRLQFLIQFLPEDSFLGVRVMSALDFNRLEKSQSNRLDNSLSCKSSSVYIYTPSPIYTELSWVAVFQCPE